MGIDSTTTIYSTTVLHYQWEMTAVKKLLSLHYFPLSLSILASLSVQFVNSVLRNTWKVGIKLKLQVHFYNGKPDVLMKCCYPVCFCG